MTGAAAGPRVVPLTGARLSGAAGRDALPLLVLGPPADRPATATWMPVARDLRDAVDPLAWDGPGQGHNTARVDAVTTDELARGVLLLVADTQRQRGDDGAPFAYAGTGRGADVGRRLAELAPDRLLGVVEVPAFDPDDPAAAADVVARVRHDLLGEGDGAADPTTAPGPAAEPGPLSDRELALVRLGAALALADPGGSDRALPGPVPAGFDDAEVRAARAALRG